jgi:hypothetical protein
MKKILLIAVTMMFVQFVYADVLTLLNGQAFEGKVLKIKECSLVFKCEKEKYFIPADSIFSVEFDNVNDPVYEAYMNLSNNDACLKGMVDAQQFHGKVGAHVLLGFLFGPFAIIGAALANPTPYKGGTTVMLSKNRELFNDPAYLNCYKKKAKGKNAGNAAIGWGMWIALAIVAST